MLKQRSDSEDHQPQDYADAILHYQWVYSRWIYEPDKSTRVILNDEMKHAHERLWLTLGPVFLTAAKWLIRKPWAKHLLDLKARDSQDHAGSLAMLAYLSLVEEIPRLKVDSSQNVVAFLKTVIHYALYDEYKRLTKQREGFTDSLDQPAHPGTAVPLGEALPHQQSLTANEKILTEIAQGELLKEFLALRATILGHTDQIITYERMLKDPPTSFADIATMLGPGWREEAVRKRYARARKKLLKLLKERGWDECP